MNFIDSIKDALGLTPKGPMYGIDYLVFHNERYQRHVCSARENFFKMLTDKRWCLLAKEGCEQSPLKLLSDIKWVYIPTIRSWTDEEFIPKIRQFLNTKYNPSPMVKYGCSVTEHADDPLYNGTAHFRQSKDHAEEIVKALEFFLCDTRTPFKMQASLDNGECSPFEVCRWYINGKHIVERNIKRINDNFNKFISIAEGK